VPLSFPTSQPIPAKQTENDRAAFNLDARAKDAAGDPRRHASRPATPRATYGTSINVYDTQGVATPVNLYFRNQPRFQYLGGLRQAGRPHGQPTRGVALSKMEMDPATSWA
jgi:flagellar hook protein FlgE